MGNRGGGDQQVERPWSPCFAAELSDRSVDPAVGAGTCVVEGQRFDSRLDSLEAVLAAGPLVGIAGRVRAGGQLGEGDRRDRQLDRKARRVQRLEVDDDRRIEELELHGASIASFDIGLQNATRKLGLGKINI